MEKMSRPFTPFDRLGAEQSGIGGTGWGGLYNFGLQAQLSNGAADLLNDFSSPRPTRRERGVDRVDTNEVRQGVV